MATTPANKLVGGALHPNAAIQQEYVQAVLTLVRRMADDVKRQMRAVFDGQALDGAAMDESVSSQARIALNGLMDRYETLFSRVAKRATKRMLDRTLKNSAVTLNLSLREASKGLVVKTDFMTDRLQDVVKASTEEAVGLIKLIPTKYLTEVQGQVMRSITSGQGLKDLVPYLNAKYDGNVRHARNVAMDQTRKAYQAVNTERLKKIGVRQFQWVHVGGSTNPRERHLELNGEIFEYDKPPEIGEMYGKKVYGLPAQLPFCRCVARPILNFGED